MGGTGIKAKKNNDVFQASGASTIGTLTETQWTMAPALELTEGAVVTFDTGVREAHADSATTAKLVDGEAVAGAINVTGALTGAGSVTKTGAGTLTLAANNTATGAFTLTEGSVILNGSNTAWSSVSSAAGTNLTIGANASLTVADGSLAGGVNVQSTGTLTVTGTGAISYADFSNSGTFNVANTQTMSSDGEITLGGTVNVLAGGVFNQEAGSASVSNSLNVKGGTYNMLGGTLQLASEKTLNVSGGGVFNHEGGTTTSSYLLLHDQNNDNSTDTFNLSGGVLNVTATGNSANAAAVVIGQREGGTGNVNVTGGVFNTTEGRLMIGYGGAGNMSITGGEVNAKTLDVRGNFTLGGDGRLNLNTGGLVKGAGSNTITITDGTLGTLTTGDVNFTQAATLAVAEGDKFTVDTQMRQTHADGASTQTANAGSIIISGGLSGSGDIEKVGKGKLILSGANTATGTLIIREGELEIQGHGADGWDAAEVSTGATMTLNASCVRTDVHGITNNGTLRLGTDSTLAADQQIDGNGAIVVLGGGTLTSHNVNGMVNASSITVAANGTLDLSDGFTQDDAQRITNNGSIILGGMVALQSANALRIDNEGSITINQGTKFNMDAWEALLAPPTGSLTKTLTMFTGLGTVNGNGALSAKDFYLGGTSLIADDNIRAISMDNQGVLTITYWGSDNVDEYNDTTDNNLTELTLANNSPKTVKVDAGTTVVVDVLNSEYTTTNGVTTYTPGDYSLTKRGEGTLQVLSVGGNQIDNVTVTKGKIVLGAEPAAYTTTATAAERVHYEAATDEQIAAGTGLYVYDEAYGVYKPATDEQIAAGTDLLVRDLQKVTIDRRTGAEGGQKAVLDIGGSRITSMGGSLENIVIDYATHMITSVNPDKPAVLTDVELRLGNIINNDTSLVNVQFAGQSGLSGFVTVDQAGDNDLGANISVAAGSTLTIGTASNSKLAFNFMPGTIKDHGAIGDADVWDHHLIDLGQDANIINWDDAHVAFYYNGVLTKGIITTGEIGDNRDHLGIAHIDTNNTAELLWNGTGAAWNPTNTLSTNWYEGENLGQQHGLYDHDWKNYEQTSRFYALSNVHFNTLPADNDKFGTNSDIRLGQDLTVLNFTIGMKMDDSLFGDIDGDGVVGGLILNPGDTYPNDPLRTVYNQTAYTFSSGNLRVLRDLYVRTAKDLTFAGTFNIEAQNIYLYNSSVAANVTFGGTVKADNLTIGQRGVDYDCYGIYTFNGAVEVAHDLYIHVDSSKAIDAYTDQALFNGTLKVGGDAMISGFGSKGFKSRVDIGGTLTVSNCMQLDSGSHSGEQVSTSGQAAFSDLLFVEKDLVLQNGGSAILFKKDSQVKGHVVMYDGTLTLVDGGMNIYGNGGRNWTIDLMGDGGHFSVTSNTYAHITSLASTDTYTEDGVEHTRDHDFTIEGGSRNTDIYSTSHVKDLTITGGKVTFREDTTGKSNTGGIHGDVYVGQAASLFINCNDLFSAVQDDHAGRDGHTITIDGGVITMAAGTHQTLADGSKIVMDAATILAPGTNNLEKAKFVADGDMSVDFNGVNTFGAGITVNAGADEDHIHTLTIIDHTAPDGDGLRNGLLTVSGAISAAENAKIVLNPGTRVYLNGSHASMSGDVYITSNHDDVENFLNSTLTVTQAGQIDHARIHVADGASLDVIATQPVNVEQLHLDAHSSIVLANLTGTKDLDASLSCIKVTDSASLKNTAFNLYFKDDLQTMQTYALISLTNTDLADSQKLTGNDFQSLVDIYVRNWTDRQNGEFEVVTLEKDQYELKVSEDGRTLYLATFFGMIWDGGVKAGDTDADGWWKPTNTDKNWTNKDWTDGQTAIFRDLGPEDNRTASSTVHVQDTIHVDGIYVTAETTEYTFIGEGTTLRNQADDDPDITKNGAATFTMQDFGNEQLGKIDVNRGVMQIKGPTIDFTEELVVANEGTLKIFSGSSLSERVYEKGADGEFVLTDGHKILVTTPVGKLSALGTNEGDYASFSNLTADEGLLAGTSADSIGRVSGAVVEKYTIQDVTFTDANKVVDTTFSTGVVNNGTLTLAGTTTFKHSITQGTGASLALGDDAIVDIGALEYTKDVTYGSGDEERLHTYHLFTTDGNGAGVTDTTGDNTLFTEANVMINGAVLTKYKNSVLTVHGYDAANGTITLALNGVETPHWDPAWGIDQKKSPWLGHLILDDNGKLANGNYMHYDSDATNATEGTYRYNQLLSEGTVSQVNPNATSIVVSFRIADAADKVFASGYKNLGDGSAPTGEIWVYDTGSAFSTKVAGYVNGDTVNLANDGTISDLSGSGRLNATNLVTHMVLTDTSTEEGHTVHTTRAVGGSVYTNSTGNSETYISVMDSRVTVDTLIGGNVWGDLKGETNVYVHQGHVGQLIGGGYWGQVDGINILVDGGTVDHVYASGSTGNAFVNGDVHVQLLGGTVGQFTTSKTNNLLENGWIKGNVVVDYTSDVKGTTLLQAKVMDAEYNAGKRATLNLINNNGVDELGNQIVFDLMNTRINGFDIINIGENGLVKFDVHKFMDAQNNSTNKHKVEFTGTGRIIMSNSDERNDAQSASGQYHAVVNEGLVFQLDNSFIHHQGSWQNGAYPILEIKDGATFDISNMPDKKSGGISVQLFISGHGVDGLGAMYKGGTVGMRENFTALPYITIKGNTSFGGSESFCCDHNNYQPYGFVNMTDGGLNHTLTKQGSSTWELQRITVEGGTLNIVDTSTLMLTRNSSASPWAGANGGARAESSTTDLVIDTNAKVYVDNRPFESSSGSNQINSFSARSLSGNGTLQLNSSQMYLYTDAANTEFYAEFLDEKQQFRNNQGYTYAVFGGKITDTDSNGANMLIKAGDGRQFLSGSESTYDGTTRMDDGILYLLGTSHGNMVKGTSTVSEGVLGTSHLEWNGGTLTLGNGVRIYNNGQALSGAAATEGVSEMLIRVNGLTSTSDVHSVTVGSETKTADGQTYHKVDDLSGVETVLCHGIYEDGTRYYSGDVVDTATHGDLYVLKNPYAQEVKNMSDLLVTDTTKTVNDVVYTKVDTDGMKALSVAGVYNDGTAYTAGADLDTAAHGDLYVNTSSTATVTVTLPEAANVAVNSTYLMVQEDTFTSDAGVVYHKVDTTGIRSLSVDGIYTDGTTYHAGDTVDQDKELYVQKAENSMVFVTLTKPRFDDATYSGVLSDAQKIDGVGNKGRLVKVGLGTLTLDQYNAYTGGTDVRAGTLNVQGWGLLGGTSSANVDQTAGSSLMLSYDGSYGDDECFFINTDMNITGRGDVRWNEETGYTAALISNVGKDFNTATNFTLAGTIDGDGNVLHMGKGTLYIDGWKAVTDEETGITSYVHDNTATGNTYTGGTTVTDGRVFVRKDAGLGTTAEGEEANLVTLKGTEVHFEDCEVTLAALADKGRLYNGNSIEGKIVVGTENGIIRATGAEPNGGTMNQTTTDMEAKPTIVTIQGTGYWAETTDINKDGSLVFQGGAATNCGERFTDHTSKQGAGYLEGSGNLVLDNDGSNGALAVDFSSIGEGKDGFTGNIYVQGKNAALFFDDGDFDASGANNRGATGNITVSGENVGIVARESGIVVASGSKITLASNADTWKQGKTTYTVGEGENQMEIGPERAGGAAITAKYVTVVGGATLEVIGGHVDGYDVQTGQDLDKLKQAATLTVAEAAANGSAISAWGDERPDAYTMDRTQELVNDDMRAYNRVYDYNNSLNRTSVGVIDTQTYESGPLRLAANSNLVLSNSSLNLSGSSLNLQRTATEKINLSLEFGQITYDANGDPSQIVLFTDVNGLYISHENMLGTTPDVYAQTGNDIYVFKANEYFQNCWQITDDTLLVYDTKAKVIYLDYAVPEPTTGALSVLALAALAARRRRKK